MNANKEDPNEFFIESLKDTYFRQIFSIYKEISGKVSYPFRDDGKLTCNNFNPNSKIVLNIKEPLKKVKLVLAEEYNQYISIVMGRED